MDGGQLRAWRREERERLLALRQDMPPTERRAKGLRVEAGIKAVLETVTGPLGVYWPFKAEFDPRGIVDWAVAAGRIVALPVVVDRRGPLEYRAWKPGEKLVDGVWNIPVPEKRELVVPAAVLAPLVGFDKAGYRLGYGGGYFDRTLAALTPQPMPIGVGFAIQEIETIHPQDFDIPMAAIVTEEFTRRPGLR